MNKNKMSAFCMAMSAMLFSCQDPVATSETNCKYLHLIADKIEAMGMPRPADSYNYPTYPGLDSWQEMSNEEKTMACQIPPNIVSNIPTTRGNPIPQFSSTFLPSLAPQLKFKKSPNKKMLEGFLILAPTDISTP